MVVDLQSTPCEVPVELAMEGLVKGLLNVALDAANTLLNDKSKHRNDASPSSSDRSTWAEVAAGTQEGNDQESGEWIRPSRKNEDGDWRHESNSRRPYKSYEAPEEHKQAFKRNASEQKYSEAIDSSAVDIEPTEEELSDFRKACSRLWELDLNRLIPGQDYEIDCGEGKKIYNKEDMAENTLFRFVTKDVFRKPTYARFHALLDNYHADQDVSENLSSKQEQEQLAFVEEISRTAPVQYLFKYLVANRVISPNMQEFKQQLHRLWFELYRRDNTRNSSSAFEHVFVGEIKNQEYDEVSGLHNWIQFYIEEAKGTLDYQGYIMPRRRGVDLPDSYSQLITVQFTWNGAKKPESSTFIGVSPEFELALFTLCFFCGQEDNHLALGPYNVNIKCYRYGRNKIGSVFPIAEE